MASTVTTARYSTALLPISTVLAAGATFTPLLRKLGDLGYEVAGIRDKQAA